MRFIPDRTSELFHVKQCSTAVGIDAAHPILNAYAARYPQRDMFPCGTD